MSVPIFSPAVCGTAFSLKPSLFNNVWYDTGVRVKVLFFGQLKDIVHRTEDTFDATGPLSLEQVFERSIFLQHL